MDEIVWIRPAGYDPAVQPGTILRPEAALPAFQVLERRLVVMMFNPGHAWEIKPFTQLTLRIVESGAPVTRSP
ncbi:hypothetical protein [Methylobacterium sp. J-090]|uniref:hypothetical protein n=1 Tax=Methylobacterium sp. J-090 TaxID=2836666 RepID=UPI001FB9F7AE|nr:hypothetical protein [Methylobacterium sp. J-090]MCJ2081152.1 hypothetical protein [Methylobacterium sp. J-090]